MEASWWTANNLRLIQNNLRETDANLDVDRLIGDLKKLSANVLMMNAGGIVAFYPTKLDYHYRAMGQQKDLLKEAIDQAHANGMKFIARFDFSKAHESIFRKQPEWFYRTKEGREVNYFGIVHTCINGYYQREYSLKLIDEVISHYDVDGIFFNMFGYQTRDYSGRNYGICYCGSCRSRFNEAFGMELPETEEQGDPAYRAYREFQEQTTREMLDRIHAFVKGKNKEIAISTYHEHKVDIVRKESNTDKGRAHPVWLYSASENVQSLEDAWDDKLVSNCCINAVDLVHRFAGVSRHEVNIRLKESLASGSGLDFCIIGVFDDYPERDNLETVADIFQYHRENEQYYGHFLSMADAALIKPGNVRQKNRTEYLGLYKMLKEDHIVFDVIHQNNLAAKKEALLQYKLLIIPDIASFTEDELHILEEVHAQGVNLISTGLSFTEDDANKGFLERVFGAKPEGGLRVLNREAAYLQTGDKQLFPSFESRDWVFLDGAFYDVEYGPHIQKQLPLVSPSTYGPPERASGHRISGTQFGAGIRAESGRLAVHLPWQPGELYYRHGFADHKSIVSDLLKHSLDGSVRLTTNAPPHAEIFFHRLDDRKFILHLLNLSGFNGVSYFEPLPVHDIRIELHGIGSCHEALNLVDQTRLSVTMNKEDALLALPVLHDFAAFLISVE
ncbi:alpha-amylase family protein [Paenibacillus sepulcri]|uniref:Family 10 glycosylhydrolase n=1 Tax=Paenibacillus sepulcri TaxID=359917 RepID=A0ABS7C7J0_9BACL|nr:family 10 glycosylhydrolase [Paenibacillus sepulcri]